MIEQSFLLVARRNRKMRKACVDLTLEIRYDGQDNL